jgi:hypothetical protein
VIRDYVSIGRFEELCAERDISNETSVVFYGDRNNWWGSKAFWVNAVQQRLKNQIGKAFWPLTFEICSRPRKVRIAWAGRSKRGVGFAFPGGAWERRQRKEQNEAQYDGRNNA